MRTHLRPALVVLLLLTALTGFTYPMAMTGLATLFFRRAARGSLIIGAHGVPRGSTLIAQPFTGAGYFQPRASAAATDASVSGGTNLGPTNPALADSLMARAARLRTEAPELASTPIPADLLTASASGLDPDLSPEAAHWQAWRVARARALPNELVDSLVAAHIEGRLWGLFGEPRVNVLLLDLALDSVSAAQHPDAR
ncbi:MAG TPA: potassium-transporting ATPase subunit KdpC [Gemmatimonadales bacterium]|nr:potassium-transporting ATPase subunit KdpC [Gemmatimonadales bacterium]